MMPTLNSGLSGSRITKRVSRWVSLIAGLSLTLMVGLVSAQSLLNDNYPERYTVVKGDTLWDISSNFLRDPWRWPEIWQSNPQVENPDLIFPGDVLVMTFVDGKPVLKALRRETVKLSPQARAIDFADAIPPIDPGAIAAYINAPLVTDDEELSKGGYVVDGVDNRLLIGKYDQFYARNIAEPTTDTYRVFRPGRTFVDPVSRENLGYEAVHLGDANLLKMGDPARLVLTKGYQDVGLRDRLRPIEKKEALPFFYPKAPDNDDIRGVILEMPNRATELGAMSVVAINLGEREGVNAGDVFRVLSQTVVKEDPVTGQNFTIPEEKIGLAMVFRTFEKVSYALITDSNRQVRPGDIFVSPKEK